MTDKRTRKKSDPDKDVLAGMLPAHSGKKMEKETETDRLRQEILSDAEIVTRWKKRSFYIS